MASQIKLRRDSAANWETNNTVVLAEGEIGVDLTSGKFKLGNGTSTWAALSYFQTGAGGVSNYNDLTNLPTIPTNTNQLTNGAGFITGTDRLTNGLNEVVIDAAGTLVVNNGEAPSITGPDGVKISTADGKQLMLDWTAAAVNPYPGLPQLSTAVGLVSFGYGGVSIEVNNAVDGSYWQFTPTGALQHSNGSFTKTINSNLMDSVTTQVIWTATQNNISGVKLTIQVECREGANASWDTQVCEAVVAVKGYNSTTEPVMVVYGVTHTSVSPLMICTSTVPPKSLRPVNHSGSTRVSANTLASGDSLMRCLM